ncbi:MAG: hypothetical protein U1D55_19230 [Phycisphaerae bacterium]
MPRGLSLTVVLGALCGLSNSYLAAQIYVAVPLGTLGGASATANGVNDAGMVVGVATTSHATEHAFVWQAGVMTDLGTLPGHVSSQAYSISNTGLIVGESQNANLDESAVIWRRDATGSWQIEDLGTLGGVEAIAWRVSDSGFVAGYADSDSSLHHPFLWNAGEMFDLFALGALSNLYGDATGVNRFGQCVGLTFSSAIGPARGFYYDGLNITDITPSGANVDCQPQAINSNVEIAGHLRADITGGAKRAAIFRFASGWEILPPLPGDNSNYGYDINDAGVVVGISYRHFPVIFHGFVYAHGAVTDLNAVTSGAPAPIVEAWDVSENGYIAANADNGQITFALLLRPSNLGCLGDLTGDLRVNEADLGVLLQGWNQSADGDLNGDGRTDESDLGILMQNWMNVCP